MQFLAGLGWPGHWRRPAVLKGLLIHTADVD
jgi:hypothetical protein